MECPMCRGPMAYSVTDPFAMPNDAVTPTTRFKPGDSVVMHSWRCDEKIRDRVHLRKSYLSYAHEDISAWVEREQQELNKGL